MNGFRSLAIIMGCAVGLLGCGDDGGDSGSAGSGSCQDFCELNTAASCPGEEKLRHV